MERGGLYFYILRMQTRDLRGRQRGGKIEIYGIRGGEL